MEKLVYTDKEVVKNLYEQIASGRIKTIITDVTMVAAGIRKGALQRLGVEVKCYLSDERAVEQSKKRGTTRSQEAIRLAVEEHPDALFVFGNAPTALIELCDLIRKGKCTPVRGYCRSRRIRACERVEIHDKDIHGSTEDYCSGQTGRK